MSIRLLGAIELPDGLWVRGRGLRNTAPDGAPPEFGLYLGTHRLRRRHQQQMPWPQEWINWPDFLVPRDRETAVKAIVELHRRAHQPQAVEVACGGGIGRTGTAIACLATLAGLPPSEAISWTRAHYHRRAVETPWQRRWVTTFAHQAGAGTDRPGGATPG